MTRGRFSNFSPKALSFLRALKRNNDRKWFRARKDQYELLLRAPMIGLIERLAGDFRTFAPDLVANPKTSLYRIYRDTRFSANKTPLKTHVAAVFPCRGLAKHQGAGLYLEVAPCGVWVGGGMYAPETSQIQAVREHIAANSHKLRAIVESPGFKRGVGPLSGEQLQRVPRGFPRDHQPAEYLTYRQFLAGREFLAAFATSPRFYHAVLNVFRQVAPLATFLTSRSSASDHTLSTEAEDQGPQSRLKMGLKCDSGVLGRGSCTGAGWGRQKAEDLRRVILVHEIRCPVTLGDASRGSPVLSHRFVNPTRQGKTNPATLAASFVSRAIHLHPAGAQGGHHVVRTGPRRPR